MGKNIYLPPGYKKKLLESLLVSSTTRDEVRIPAMEDFILCEIANATIDYTYGHSGGVTPFEGFNEEKLIMNASAHLHDAIFRPNRDIEPRIKKAILVMVSARRSKKTGEISCDLYGYFNEIRKSYSQKPDYFLKIPERVIANVKHGVILSTFPPLEREVVRDIGKFLREHIDKDLKRFRKDY